MCKNNPSNFVIGSTILCYIYLQETEMWSMKPAEKLEQAKIHKEKGTNYFKSNKISLAIKVYQKVLKYLSVETDFEGDLKPEKNNLELTTQLNLALCYIKTNEYVLAKESCDKALEFDPQNEKAFFRRGLAHLGLASPEVAIKDFQEVIKIEPKNTAASKQILICNNLIKKQLAKEKKLYANMFDKFAQEDKQVCEK